VQWGPVQTLGLARAVTSLTLVLLPLPYLALNYGGLYLLFALGAGGALLWTVAGQGTMSGAARTMSAALKVAMVLGMVALALGRNTP